MALCRLHSPQERVLQTQDPQTIQGQAPEPTKIHLRQIQRRLQMLPEEILNRQTSPSRHLRAAALPEMGEVITMQTKHLTGDLLRVLLLDVPVKIRRSRQLPLPMVLPRITPLRAQHPGVKRTHRKHIPRSVGDAHRLHARRGHGH